MRGVTTLMVYGALCGGRGEHILRMITSKERLQIKTLKVALVTPVYSTSFVIVFVFLTSGKETALRNTRERVCKVFRRCQAVMASFPSSLAAGRFYFM